MLSKTELVVRRKSILQFIRDDPVEVVLHRPIWGDPNSDGGRVQTDETLLPSQRFRQVMFKHKLAEELGLFQGVDQGMEVMYILVGPWNADVQQLDWYLQADQLHGNGIFRIEFVAELRVDRTAAAVSYQGPPEDA